MGKKNDQQSRLLGDYDLSFEQILVRSHAFNPEFKPDLDSLKTCVLKEGPIAYKVAKYWTIRDGQTGQIHHHTLTLETLNRTQRHGWRWQGKHSINIDDEDEIDEIQRLFNFLSIESHVSGEGEFVVINLADVDSTRFRQILDAVSNEKKLALMEEILQWVDNDPQANEGLIKLASDHPHRSKSLVAALNYGRLSKALSQFKELVEVDHKEIIYQRFLEDHYWMFGSEYSVLLPNRNIIKGMELDFPLRRTVDGYLDIIEIKRPQNDKPLFRRDARSNLSESSDLVEAVTQADNYLTNIDAEQYQIKFHEELDAEKVRAKVIIGRDGDAEQTKALRRLNARTNRIEIITFDQLIRIAERILAILIEAATSSRVNQGENL